ncbi:NUDIX domain-containing protein [soil metagenome]
MKKIAKQRITVYGYIIDSSGKLLIIKRSANDSSPNLWEMPGGGLELGESPSIGVIREVKEETNLDVIPHFPIYIQSGISRRDPTQQVIRIAYFSRPRSSSSVTLSNEHSDYSWVNPSAINISPLSNFLKETLLLVKKYPYLSTALWKN